VLLTEVGGRVDPVIGFPTAGFNGIPEFPEERHNAVIDNGNNTPIVPPPVNNPVTLSGLAVPGASRPSTKPTCPTAPPQPGALTQAAASTCRRRTASSLNIGGISVISGGVAGVSSRSPHNWATP
jgi:hypothetical protein